MQIKFGEFLSRILIKARKKYRFAGIVVGRFGIGIFWPTKKELEIRSAQPLLPGISNEP